MTAFRNVLSGAAALTLIASAGVARADDHYVRPEIQRGAATDGRGDTDVQSARTQMDRPLIERYAPEKNVTPSFQHAAPPQMKGEYQVRFGEDRDSVSLPGASARMDVFTEATRSAMRSNSMMKAAPRPALKADITNRIADVDGEGGGAAENGGSEHKTGSIAKSNRASSRLQGLAGMPVKTEISMRISEHSDDAL